MRISQVLINLLGNAVKFTPEQGKVRLTVREDRTGTGKPLVRFAVRDTGVGIAKEEQERVFRAFEQAGVNASKQQGTGLGLSIVRGAVEQHRGRCGAESQPGEGSRFWVSLPALPTGGG